MATTEFLQSPAIVRHREEFEKSDYWVATDELNQIALGFVKPHNIRYLDDPSFQNNDGNYVNILPASQKESLSITLKSYLEQDTIKSQIKEAQAQKKTARFLIPYIKNNHHVVVKIDIDGSQEKTNISILDPLGNNRADVVEDIRTSLETNLNTFNFDLRFTSNNTVKLQEDHSSCGVIAARIIEEFCKDDSFSSAENNDQNVLARINGGKSFDVGAHDLRNKYFKSIATIKEDIQEQNKVKSQTKGNSIKPSREQKKIPKKEKEERISKPSTQKGPRQEKTKSLEKKKETPPEIKEEDITKAEIQLTAEISRQSESRQKNKPIAETKEKSPIAEHLEKNNQEINDSQKKIKYLRREKNTNTGLKYGVKGAAAIAGFTLFINPVLGIAIGIVSLCSNMYFNSTRRALKEQRQSEREKLEKLYDANEVLLENAQAELWQQKLAVSEKQIEPLAK